MLGHRIFTKQTGPDGQLCSTISIVERKFIRRAFYFAIALDRETSGPMIIGSSHGGVNIEEVAEEYPAEIIRVSLRTLSSFITLMF